MSSGFAILGAGIFAKEAHLPAVAQLGSAAPTLRAIYSRSEKSAQDLATTAQTSLNLTSAVPVYHDGGDAATGLDALLARADIQSVIVILPITTQPAVILKALAAGKHVISEKPIAPDVAGALELIRTYEKEYKPKDLIWRVAENFESEPIYRRAGQAVRDGKIGKVTWFRAQVLIAFDKESKWYKTPWRTVPDYQGGFVLDGGVHFAAVVRVVLPSALTQLSGFASLKQDYLAPSDTVHVVAKSADGASGTYEVTFAAPNDSYSKGVTPYTFTGTGGWLTIGSVPADENKPGQSRLTIINVGEGGKETREIIDFPNTGVFEELQSFFQALAGKDDGLQNPRHALQDLAFIQAALTSNGNLVDLEALTKV